MIIHDITVPISPDLPVYPGDPEVEITPLMSLASGDIASVSRLCCGTHIGTHIDPPAHFIPGGLTVDQLPLDLLVGPCRVLDAGNLAVITAEWLASQPLDGVSRLLFKTSNSALWHRERTFQRNYVYVDSPAARLLVERGLSLVGIDYLSIEKFDFDRPETHLILLGSGVIIVEGLDLADVEPGDYELICLPLRIQAGDGSPARAILRRDS
ncbi:MAG: cyclase family protein [Acidobacteriota bacterium]